MTRVKIYLTDGRDITIFNKIDFVSFVSVLFKSKIYVGITENDSSNLAINTNKIIFIEELSE